MHRYPVVFSFSQYAQSTVYIHMYPERSRRVFTDATAMFSVCRYRWCDKDPNSAKVSAISPQHPSCQALLVVTANSRSRKHLASQRNGLEGRKDDRLDSKTDVVFLSRSQDHCSTSKMQTIYWHIYRSLAFE